MKTYHVQWEIEVDADSPKEAAKAALAIQRNPESTATIFDVLEFDTDGDAVRIDLFD